MVCDAGQGAALRIAIILAWRGRSGRDQASEGGQGCGPIGIGSAVGGTVSKCGFGLGAALNERE